MKKRWVFGGLFLLLALGVVVAILQPRQPDPGDLRFWLRTAGGKDWTSEAQQGRADAQYLAGLNLIRSNLIIMVDSVPRFSNLPLVGKRFFETTSGMIDNRADPQQLLLAYRWIKKSADQGYRPALEAEKLFRGKPGLGQSQP